MVNEASGMNKFLGHVLVDQGGYGLWQKECVKDRGFGYNLAVRVAAFVVKILSYIPIISYFIAHSRVYCFNKKNIDNKANSFRMIIEAGGLIMPISCLNIIIDIPMTFYNIGAYAYDFYKADIHVANC